MSARVLVEFGPLGSGLYSEFSVVESDTCCRIWCHMFVKTLRTVRLRYASTQIVMVRSHSTVEILCRKIDTLVRPLEALNLQVTPHKQHMGVTWKRWSHSSIYNKNDANKIFWGWYKIGFEIKNEIEGQCQSSPKLIGILTVLRCICGSNLEILSVIGGEWWHGEADNMVIFHF